jgi:hypothetical protein
MLTKPCHSFELFGEEETQVGTEIDKSLDGRAVSAPVAGASVCP